MNAIVITHVPVVELPQAWRDRLGQAADALVTVRIEAEAAPATAIAEDAKTGYVADVPGFGIWRGQGGAVGSGTLLQSPPSFQQAVCSMGFARVDLTKASALADELGDDAQAAKLL